MRWGLGETGREPFYWPRPERREWLSAPTRPVEKFRKKIASVFHGIQGDGTGGILPIHIIALLPPQRAMKQHISVLTKTKDQVALSSLLAAAFQRKKIMKITCSCFTNTI